MSEIYLGINWEQNSTASLMIDGKIVGCISEERFTRKKNDESYPYNSINWLLKEFNIKKNDINAICYISEAWSPAYILTRHYTQMSIQDYIDEQNKIWYPRLYENKKVSELTVFKKKLDLNQFPGKKYWSKKIKNYLKLTEHANNIKLIEIGKNIRREIVSKHLGINFKNIFFIDHSKGHIFYGYFSNNKKENSISISMDAFGDFVNYRAVNFYYKKNKLFFKEIVKGGNFIIGRLYRYVTLILGLKPNEHEYKVMGLAPYTKKEYFQNITNMFFSLQDVNGINFQNKSKIPDFYFYIKKLLDGKRFDAIAGGLQDYTEKLVNKWINNLIIKTNSFNLSLSGGVAMNVKNNLKISENKKIKNVFVPPSPDDSSQSIGACYVHYYNVHEKRPKPLDNAYLGYKIVDEEVNKILKKLDTSKYKIINKNINQKAVQLLIKNKIIARCVDRAEFGARALGNRSILAHPSNEEVKKNINEKIKNRDFWMPFAASVMDKYAKDYFYLNSDLKSYKYMTSCVKTKPKYIKKLKAGLHPYDDTCRPQVVFKKDNNNYYDLIDKFGKKTGVYALLNTSFNLHGYPLVNTPNDAIKVFKSSNLDALILGKHLIIKR